MQRLILFLALSYLTNAFAAPVSLEKLASLVVQNKYQAAIKVGKDLLSSHADAPQIQLYTAYALQMNRQVKQASDLYLDLIRRYPELPEPRNNLAMIYLAKGDYDAASQLLVDALNTHSSYATAYQNLSRIYTGIASEAYRRALSESNEPAKYANKIELAALTQIRPVDQNTASITQSIPEKIEPAQIEPQVELPNVATVLNAQVIQWAKVWSNKDFSAYTSFYSTEHRPSFETHSAWVEHRRKRIMKPGFIKIGVSDIKIQSQNNDRAIVDFKQSFDSPAYSDRVKKRLSFRRVGDQWKITSERVLSVL